MEEKNTISKLFTFDNTDSTKTTVKLHKHGDWHVHIINKAIYTDITIRFDCYMPAWEFYMSLKNVKCIENYS